MRAHHALLGLSGPGSDLDDYTSLLLHCDGADEGTTFTDSSPFAHTVKRTGSTFKTDNGQAKFGATSLTGSGSGASNYISAPDHASLRFGGADFAIECWLYQASASADATDGYQICSKRATSNNEWTLTHFNGEYRFNVSADGTNFVGALAWTQALDVGAWTHLALVRTGNTLKLFRNGANLGDKSFSTAIFGGTASLKIGGDGINVGGVNGWMDEIRVSKIARWTSGFPVPIAPYN